MKHYLTTLLLLLATMAWAQTPVYTYDQDGYSVLPDVEGKTKIAFIGNSITYGQGLNDGRKFNAYPARVQNDLGDSYIVQNFGNPGYTMSESGKSYMSASPWNDVLAFRPNIVFIKLGTNDSQPRYWAGKDNFKQSAQHMIDALKALSTHPRIIMLHPIKAYSSSHDINEETIVNYIIPAIDEVAAANDLEVIDLHDAIPEKNANDESYFFDGVHPNKWANKFISDIISAYLTANPNKPGTTTAAAGSSPVEVYDLKTWAPNKSGNSFTSAPSTTASISSSDATVYAETANFEGGHNLNGRFAWESGLSVSANQGLLLTGKRKIASIQGLRAGDIVVVETATTYENIYIRSKNVSYLADGNTITITTADENDTQQKLVSGQPYTMISDGSFDFYTNASTGYRISKVTILSSFELGATGYATYSNLTNTTLALPSGLKAYVVAEGSSDKKDVATMVPVENIPAGVGVLLRGASNRAYTLSTTSDDAATIASNSLKAVTSDMTLTESTVSGYTNFILAQKNDVVGFYRTSGSGTLKAGKAYLQLNNDYFTTDSDARGLTFEFTDEETTGIGDAKCLMNSGRENRDIYDLQGRKVTHLTKGLYIVNGKKVVIR
ncbi:MAG: hypothetical protein IJU11_06160 [Prevotella sp.]|nr:hypothetical protein [Prevotella sp.]